MSVRACDDIATLATYIAGMTDARPEQVSKPFNATIRPPGSKSMANRALVMAALNRDQCELRNVLFADDLLPGIFMR